MQVLEKDIVQALINDQSFSFKVTSTALIKGVCPSCGKRDVFVSIDKPWRLQCNRRNNCDWSDNIKNIMPDLFENFSERFPTTSEDPHATAKAYMSHQRNFPLNKIGSWFEQGSFKLSDGTAADTVRFMLWDGFWWDRLIDGRAIKVFGDKAKIKAGTKFKNKGWTPPGQTISEGDTVVIVEGIFHAIAIWLSGYKVIAAISSGNLPREIIQKKKSKKINWVIAFDDDKAGRFGIRKFLKEIKSLNETVDVWLTGCKDDWDDLYTAGKLNDAFFKDSLHRGRMAFSETIGEKAYWWYLKTQLNYTVLSHYNRLYSVLINNDLNKDLRDACNDVEQKDIEEETNKEKILIDSIDKAIKTKLGKDLFKRHLTTSAISNCLPEFLYCEVDKQNDELAYFFNISFPNKTHDQQVAFPGSAIESPASFNKALLNKAAGATFDGSANQLKRLRDDWFREEIKRVDTINFLGYEKESKTYVYQGFAVSTGRLLKLNDHGFFSSGKHSIKTNFKSFAPPKVDHFNNKWLDSFNIVFADNGMMALSFWFLSLFAEQIREEFKSFPFFELTGEHGAGKTSLVEFLWKLLGREEYEGFDPSKATFSARARNFAQVSNMPVVLIESDRTEDKAKKGAFDFEELKPIFNGRPIRSTGSFNRGNDTQEPPFRASIVIAQNDTVDASPAMLSRIIHCHCTKTHFSPRSKALANSFDRAPIEGDKGVGGFLLESLTQEKKILEIFRTEFPRIDALFTSKGDIKDQRIIKTHSMIAAGFKCLQVLFPQIKNDEVERLQKFAYSRAMNRQTRMDSDHPLVALFWDTYDYLNVRMVEADLKNLPPIMKGYGGNDELEKEEKVILNHSKDENLIAINLQHFEQQCNIARINAISPQDFKDLKKLLPGSRRHKFIDQKTVKSALLGMAKHCWVFELNSQKKTES